MSMLEEGRELGRRQAEKAEGLVENMEAAFASTLDVYPTLVDIDLAKAIRDYDRERLACEPDYGKFPEMIGLLDRHVGEREGFREATGLDETAIAFHFSWRWFVSRRINAHHVPRYNVPLEDPGCTNIFFPDGEEGVVAASNRDDVRHPHYEEHLAKAFCGRLPVNNDIKGIVGSVSSSLYLDEEPECSFPCDPWELMPDECYNSIDDMMDFMTRYREFHGPANQLWTDRSFNAVAVEKTTCRVAFRRPTVNGAVCVTACAYLDPEINAYKQERLKRVMEIRGETQEDSVDWHYDAGAAIRYRRLIDLTNAEANRAATLWGTFDIVSDTAVPWPDRICLAGEVSFPDKEAQGNWTLTQNAQVMTGPNRRMLARSIRTYEGDRPITDFIPYLALGEGVEIRPEWQKDIDEGRCVLAPET